MKVFLANRGNIDFGQDPTKKIYGTKSDFYVTIKDFSEASSLCRDYIDKYDIGGGAWVGGAIIDEEEQLIAYVSYNGRVWDKEDKYFEDHARMYYSLTNKSMMR